MPVGVYILGLTVFCIGTTEFMISGLLPGLAADLPVSVPAVGRLISGSPPRPAPPPRSP